MIPPSTLAQLSLACFAYVLGHVAGARVPAPLRAGAVAGVGLTLAGAVALVLARVPVEPWTVAHVTAFVAGAHLAAPLARPRGADAWMAGGAALAVSGLALYASATHAWWYVAALPPTLFAGLAVAKGLQTVRARREGSP